MNTPVRIARKRCSSSTAKRGQRERCAAGDEQADDDRAGEQQVRDDPGRAREVPDRRAQAARRSGTAAAPALVERDDAVRVDEAAGEPAAVEPRRPGRPEQQRRLGGDVGREAAAGGDGHVAPRRAGRAAGGRIDQMVLAGAAAEPGPNAGAAGREAALVDGDRVAAGQADRDRNRSSPGRRRPTPSPAPRRARASSTVRPLTTPFRSSTSGSVRSSIRPRSETESSDGTAAGDGRAPSSRQCREVAVVAGGKNGATDGRGDQAAGGARGVECCSKHRRHLLGDERNAKGSSVEQAQLRVLRESG